MLDKYFTGTPAQTTIIARYQLYSLNEDRGLRNDLEVIEETAGDTEVRVLYENDAHLVFISIDKDIEVIIAIYKDDFENSESMELSACVHGEAPALLH